MLVGKGDGMESHLSGGNLIRSTKLTHAIVLLRIYLQVKMAKGTIGIHTKLSVMASFVLAKSKSLPVFISQGLIQERMVQYMTGIRKLPK